MIKRSLFALAPSLFASALLASYLAYGADPSGSVSVEVVPAGSAPSVPAQAQAQGYTTLAFDGDMTKGFDMYCGDPFANATEAHQWYGGGAGTMASGCSTVRYPHTDETDGSKVLDIVFGPNTYTGSILTRQGIATSDYFGAHQTTFPINAYYECTTRIDPVSLSHMALWEACWFVNDAFPRGQSGGNLGIEFDLTEFHGGYTQGETVGNAINWDCRSSCQQWGWGGDIRTKIPSYDGSKFHKYGMLIYQTSATNMHIRSYVDDVLLGEGDAQIFNNGTFDEAKQRNYILIHMNAGCNWDEGLASECSNGSIANVYSDGGNTHVQFSGGTQLCYTQQFLMGITGVQGVTSPINGNWSVSCPAQGQGGCCSNFLIYQPLTQNPIPFSGTYVANTGKANQWDDSAHLYHTYVKSYRVWSCDKWATTQCSKFNPN
jgi:hypothetical protein